MTDLEVGGRPTASRRPRLTRRDLLRGALVTSAAVVATRAGLPVIAEDAGDHFPVRAGHLTVEGPALARGTVDDLALESDGRLSLAAGRLRGGYVSPVFEASHYFDAVGSRWQASLPDEASLEMQLRISLDGLAWSEWLTAEPLGMLECGGSETAGELVLARGRYLQFRLTVHAGRATGPVFVKSVTLTYLDSSQGPSRQEAAARTEGRAAGAGQPPIISRAAWGCPEPYSSPLWTPQYYPTQKMIVHHTVTSNNPPDPAAAVRAVYYYHYNLKAPDGTLWGDVGYNFLIDQYGNIYEGRFGGENVAAGHAMCYNAGSVGVALLGDFTSLNPTASSVEALVNLLAWKCSRFRIDPLAKAYFIDQVLYNICGHRDCGGGCNNAPGLRTACPGDLLYAMLPTIRTRVAASYSPSVPGYRESWVSHNTPSVLAPGQTVLVTIAVQNKGSLTWTKGDGIGSYRLGYHWFRADGSPFAQPPEDDHRTSLPYDVAPEQAVTLNAYLTAPREPGSFWVQWDMVREGYTWFAAESCQCNTPLSVSVNTIVPTLALASASLRFLSDDAYVTGPQRIAVENRGGGWINWTAASNAGWCVLESPSGASAMGIASSFVVRVDREAFRLVHGYDQPGTALISISATSPQGTVASSPTVLPVTLVLSSRPLRQVLFPSIRQGPG